MDNSESGDDMSHNFLADPAYIVHTDEMDGNN